MQSLAQHEKIIKHTDDQSGLEMGKAHSNHMADQGSDEFQYETTIKFANTEGRYLYNIEEALRPHRGRHLRQVPGLRQGHRPAAAASGCPTPGSASSARRRKRRGTPDAAAVLRQPWLWAPLVLVVDFVTKRLVLANDEVLRGQGPGARRLRPLHLRAQSRFGHGPVPGGPLGPGRRQRWPPRSSWSGSTARPTPACACAAPPWPPSSAAPWATWSTASSTAAWWSTSSTWASAPTASTPSTWPTSG